MANRWGTQFFGTLEKKPFQLACNFVVSASDSGGYGVSTLKGPGIANVYMRSSATFSGTVSNSSATITGISDTSGLAVGMGLSGARITAGSYIVAIPSATSVTMNQNGATSGSDTVTYSRLKVNPASGLVMVQFQDNYNKYLFGPSSIQSPLSGADINISTGSSLTLGNAYVITAVGTTTEAQWNAVGVPVGITPAVGVSFVAIATSGSGTGKVQAPSVSGLTSIEVVGEPNSTIISSAATVMGISSGAYMMLQCLGPSFTAGAYTPAGTISTGVIPVAAGTAGDAVTNNAGVLNSVGGQDVSLNAQTFTGSAASLTGSISYAAAAPAANSKIYLSFFLSNSMITVQGQ